MRKESYALILIAVMLLSGCQQKENNKIKIVTSFPMRGLSVGQHIINGITLALEESDYRAGDYEIELVVEDDGDESGAWNGKFEEDIAARAAEDEDVMIYLGTFNSGAAKYSIPITNKAGLVQISPGNTWPGLTQPGFAPGEPGIFYPTGVRNYFRVCPTDALQGPAAAIWASEMGLHNIYIFDDGEAYGKGIADLFEAKAKEIGLNIVGHTTLDTKSLDFTSELEKLNGQEIELIFFGGIIPNGAVPLIKGIKEQKMDVRFMGPDGIMGQDLIEQTGDAAEGIFVTVVGIPAEEMDGDFYSRYKNRFDREPDPFAGFGYEAAKIAVQSIEKAGAKDRAKILEQVSKTKDYSGLFGTWSFDQNGDTSLSLVSGNQVVDGKFVFRKILNAR